MGTAEAYPIITHKDVRRYVLGGCHHVTEAVRVTSCERLGLPDQGAVAKEPGSSVRTRRSRAKRKRESLVQNTTPGNPGRLVTLQELAIYLNVPPTALYRRIKRSQLPSFKVGRQWRLDLEKVQDWLIDGYERKSERREKGCCDK